MKLRWVIDASILGNVCKKNNNDITREFLDQVKKNHYVVVNLDVINEYKPMPGRKNLMCEQKDKEFLQQWIIELRRKFGVSSKNLPDLPLCIIRQLDNKFKNEDCIYVRLALSNNDKLLVAEETHFQNVRNCLEKNNIRMFNEIEALEYIDH
ncbi:hypothetical protein ANME2D_02064 [Candidatus Methanoperedens nitroreducens]|uniref:PIN domain-containing protein n=1 Tax=Candidatus Methanoperedens nitratireducens TaxID=1392998 RepID=A0A062V1U8_9EURY|nr:hypothetical protein [Candidatus Methanoperedens nitroreducens]KCZ71337.1 hypothetical protein ANME2D_02064 [Candidatus Methanoperedens nitroreducens]MDJ1420966.1 hypothetical protein [Candidatus Methanoperedens sp.]